MVDVVSIPQRNKNFRNKATHLLPAMYYGHISIQPCPDKSSYSCTDTSALVGGRTTFGKSETLCYKVVVDKGKHTSRKQVNGNIAIVGVSRTVAEGSCGEAMCRDMGKSGGEDSGFHGGKWRRGFILIRVIGTAASLGKTLVLSVRTHIPKCAQYLGS